MKKLTLVLLALAFLASCGNNSGQKTVEQLEKIVINEDLSLNREVAAELITAYADFANNNPDDAKSPDCLFKALELAVNMKDAENSMQILDKLQNNYANYEKTPTAIFMTASLVCEDILGDYGKANSMYEKIVKQYPESEWATTAEQAMKNLGKTPEELIREFEMMNDSLAEVVTE